MTTTALAADPTPLVWTDAELDRLVELGVLPANHSRHRVRLTRDQYRSAAAHRLFDGRRVCLLKGEVIVMPAMKEPHACGVAAVADVLRGVFGPGFFVRGQMPLDVSTADDPEPDVVVVPGDWRTYWNAPTAPDATLAQVVVEVADSSLDQDITVKAEAYATAAVADYWVLDVVNHRLLVFRDPQPIAAGGVAYRTRLTRYPGDTVALLAVPNTPIPVADFFP